MGASGRSRWDLDLVGSCDEAPIVGIERVCNGHMIVDPVPGSIRQASCGIYAGANAVRNIVDPSDVTCGRCRRTKFFKNTYKEDVGIPK